MYTYGCFDGTNYYTVSSEVPMQDPCNGTQAADDGQPSGNTTEDNILPSIPGGFMPFGLGNILPPFIAEAMKKILVLLLIIGAIVLALYLYKKRK